MTNHICLKLLDYTHKMKNQVAKKTPSKLVDQKKQSSNVKLSLGDGKKRKVSSNGKAAHGSPAKKARKDSEGEESEDDVSTLVS